jgi:uncharacterized membrane protein YhiD involved in acid resistance
MGLLENSISASMLNGIEIPILKFIVNMLICAGLSIVLAKIYVKYGNTLSNRKLFANNFLLITLTTMFIITVVKSSLALSLGLVGALSIIRFRTAIKEPEELAYLFFAIGIGLGLGADQTWVTVVAFISIISIIRINDMINSKNRSSFNMHLIISTDQPKERLLTKLTSIIQSNADELVLKRFDESENAFEVSFLVDFSDFSMLEKTKSELQAEHKSLSISYLDDEGLA